MRFLRRFTEAERMTHWVVALGFVLAGLSGLAFFHPSLFFFSHLFGGGPWTRILHPFLGLLMFVAFLRMFLQLRKDNSMTDVDREWRRKAPDLMLGRHVQMPPAGKFNGGQKAMFWVLVLCMLVLLVTGLAVWRPWFDGYVPIPAQRLALLLHAAGAAVLILFILGHIYMGIWTKGSFRAMSRGSVPEDWARLHHPAWHQEMTRGR
ncbi:MAG TPA: formate dehydrogenase subunit gamma [Rubrivivax sp.]|nr:formate dehydrogenase subunit gamma [Rubrivivax sp.]